MKTQKALSLLLATAIVITMSLNATGQQSAPPPYRYEARLVEELKRLQQAALSSDYAYRQTAYLSNNIGPRLSGSPQAERAVEYVAEEMRKLGCDVRLEKMMVPRWVRGVETGELTQFPGQATGTTQKIILTALGGSVATPAEGITAEVVVADSFDHLAQLGRGKVQGKIVLFNVPFDERLAMQGEPGTAYGQAVIYRGIGASAAARLGAVAALNRSAGGGGNRLPHTGSMSYAADAPRIPAAAVTNEDAELMAHLAAQGPIKMRLTLTPQTLPDVESHNVIADIKGTEHPEQVVIVSGHLDSWDLGTGAIDDAAGVAVSMAVVKLIKDLGLKPRRTIRVVAYMNEENGLRGGTTYAENHRAQVANHVAAIESDTGAGRPLGFFAHASPRALQMLQPAADILRSQGAGILRPVNSSPGADISPLDALGVPTFGVYQDARTYFNYHHTAGDTLDKVNPRELAENAAAMTVLAYAIANLPEALPR